jgi:peroxiredoxin
MTPAALPPSREAALRRWTALGAAVCAAGALLILVAAGLPQRFEPFDDMVTGPVIAPVPGAVAPSFSAATLNGDPVALEALRGRPVVLNFWATWCAPCEVEMPELQRLHEAYGGQVAVIGVNTGEPEPTIRAWAQTRGLTFTLALDAAREIAALYQLRGQPTTVLIAPDGRIMDIIYGPTQFESLSAALAPWLAA